MKNVFLLISFTISLSLHFVFYKSFMTMTEQHRHLRRPSSQLVAVISKPKPKPKTEPVERKVVKKNPPHVKPLPKKPKKKKPKPPEIEKSKKKRVEKPRKKVSPPKKPKQAAVKPKPEPPPKVQPEPDGQKDTPDEFAGLVPHNRTPSRDLPPAAPAKPVSGVTPNSVRPGKGSGISVRVGNTLSKKQEAAFTPQDEVKALVATDPAWETGPIVPVYELSTMALFKKKVQPEYPELLREEEIEGNVHLTVVVNSYGNVVDIKVKSSDHELMTAAAIKAIKQFVFNPATVDGVPVTSTIDDVSFIFILDE